MEAIDLGQLILRVLVGVTFAAHGVNKIKGGLDGVGGWFDSMGMRPGRVHAHLAAYGEIVAGAGLALGLLTPFAGAAIVGIMIVAGYTSHRANGFFSMHDGWEYNFVLAVIGVAAATTGPGEISLDEALGIADDLDGWVGLAISAGLGVGAGLAQLKLFYRPPVSAD